MTNEDIISHQGTIYLTIIYDDGTTEERVVKNKVLLTGRSALVNSLANQFSGTYSYYIARIIFGSNGTVGGTPRFINDNQDGLFGPVALAKPVIASIDPAFPQQVTFTTTVAATEMNGMAINEMALEMATGNLFSMSCFSDINKNSSMAIIFNWRNNFC